MPEPWGLLDLLTWPVLGLPLVLFAGQQLAHLPSMPLRWFRLCRWKARLLRASLRGLGTGTSSTPLSPKEVFPMDLTDTMKEQRAAERRLLGDHAQKHRERNFTLAHLEHLTEAAALVLPADPEQDTLQQRALRQQLQASTTWCQSLRERDLAQQRRGEAA